MVVRALECTPCCARTSVLRATFPARSVFCGKLFSYYYLRAHTSQSKVLLGLPSWPDFALYVWFCVSCIRNVSLDSAVHLGALNYFCDTYWFPWVTQSCLSSESAYSSGPSVRTCQELAAPLSLPTPLPVLLTSTPSALISSSKPLPCAQLGDFLLC